MTFAKFTFIKAKECKRCDRYWTAPAKGFRTLIEPPEEAFGFGGVYFECLCGTTFFVPWEGVTKEEEAA